MIFRPAILFGIFAIAFAKAEDWTTTDGKIYRDVQVISHDDAFVAIYDSDGGVRIPLRLLNTQLQKRFNYDAVKAGVVEAAENAAKDAQKNAVALLVQKQAEAKARDELASRQVSVQALQPASPSNAQSHSAIDPALRKETELQIDELQSDIARMRREVYASNGNHDGYYDSDGYYHISTHGAYGDKIVEDEKKIKALRAQIVDQ